MFKQTILATATAGLIALGAMGATTTAASAAGPGSGSMQFGGPGWSLQFGFGGHQQFHPKKFCAPVVKKVKWWDNWGNPHWSNVVVGQKCSFGGPGFGGPGPGFGGPGRGFGGPGGFDGPGGGYGGPGGFGGPGMGGPGWGHP